MGRVALVTGAGRRVGRAIASHLGGLGYDLALHYHSSNSGAVELQQELVQLGVKAEIFQQDLREDYSARDLVNQVIRRFDRLDLLVNNASTYPATDRLSAEHRLEEESEGEFNEALAVNLKAPFFLMKYAFPHLSGTDRTTAERGMIINILDLSAEEPFLSRSAHSVSKAALKFATELAAQSLFPVKVIALLLGHILPGDNMSEREKEAVKWLGTAPVLAAIEEIVQGEVKSGEIVRVV